MNAESTHAMPETGGGRGEMYSILLSVDSADGSKMKRRDLKMQEVNLFLCKLKKRH